VFMIRSKSAHIGRLCLAASVAITAQILPQSVPAGAEVAVQVPATKVMEKQDVYTSVNTDVKTRLSPYPSVEAPVDNLKLQINNRMISGILTGKLTNFEMDQIQEMLDDVQRQ